MDSCGEAVSYDSDSKQTISSLVGHLAEIEEAANATASPSSAKCPTGPGIVCLESKSDDATSPEETTGVDLLVHKPSVS